MLIPSNHAAAELVRFRLILLAFYASASSSIAYIERVVVARSSQRMKN